MAAGPWEQYGGATESPTGPWNEYKEPTGSSGEPVKEVGSRWHNIARTSAETVPSAAAGVVGFGAGMSAAAPVAAVAAPLTGPFAPITAGVIEFAGGLGGAWTASGAAQKVTNWMHEAFAPDDFAARQKEKAQHPYGTFAAELGTNLLGMSPKTGVEVAGKILTKPIVQRGVSAGMMGAIDAGSQYAEKGEVDPLKVAASAAAGAAMPGFNPAGKKLFGAGEGAVNALKGKKPVPTPSDLPEPPPETATQSEKDAYKEHIIAKRKAVMESQPLVETAIRNKEDGTIEKMGPKHDEARKAETKDTHEQGFMDKEGNFLTREEAYQRALKTGMLDKTHALAFPDEGLHSVDLRAAGHKDFQLTEEQKAGIPKAKDEAPVNPALKQMYEDGKVHDEGIANSKTISGLIGHLTTKYGEDHYLTQVLGALGKHLPQDMPVTILNRNEMAALNKENGLGETSPGMFHPSKGIFLEHGKGTNSIVAGHEIAHSIMKDKLDTLTNMSADHPEYAKGQAMMSEVKGIMDDVNKSVERTSLSPEQIKALDYALQNTHEFISDGLFNPGIMKHLLALEAKRPSGFLSKVVNAVGKFFGMKPEEYTALHKLLGTTQKIAKLKVGALDKTSNQALASRLSQEIHDQLGEEGIAVAHSSPHKFAAFEWIKHALRGEGAMAFGAGTYHSQRNSSDRGYFKMSKRKVREDFLKDKPELKKQYDDAVLETEAMSHDRDYAEETLREIQSDYPYLSEMKSRSEMSFNSWAREELGEYGFNDKEFATEVANDPVLRAKYEKDMASTKKQLEQQEADLEARSEKQREKIKEAEKALADAEAIKKSVQDKIDGGTKVPTYHSTIKAKAEELLDWNSKDQSSIVSKAFEALGIAPKNTISRESWRESTYKRLGAPSETIWMGDFTTDAGPAYYQIEPKADGTFRYKESNGQYKEAPSLEAAKKAISDDVVLKSGEELYKELSKKFEPTPDEARSRYKELFPDEKGVSALNVKRMIRLVGDTKASIALMEQGVVGNVHDAAGGKESKHRNYVTFDDSKVKQNFVALGSKGEAPLDAPHSTTDKLRTEPVETPEKPDHKVVKSWDELVSHGERVLFEKGEEAAMKFFDAFKDFKKTWGEHQAGVDKLVHENIQSKAADERLNVINNKKLVEIITSEQDNTAVRQAIETGEMSTGFSGRLKEAVNIFKSDLKSYWERANKEGVINGYIENYFPHMLDWVGGPEGVGGPKPEPGAMKALINEILGKRDTEGSTNMFGMDAGTKRDLKRSLDTIEDLNKFVAKLNAAIERSYTKRLGEFADQKRALEKEGKYTGHLVEPTKPFNLKVKTDNIVEAHKIYTHSISKAVANKKLLEGLKDLRDQLGEPVLRPIEDNKMPFGWQQLDSPQLAGIAVHPDLVPSLKFLFDAGPGQWMKAALSVSQAVKRFNVIGSFFHAKSLLEVLNSAKTPLWSPLYHGIIAPLAEQGAKAFGKEVRLSAISKAIDQYHDAKLGDSADRWVREDGLNIEVPEDVTQGVLTSIGKASDELIGKFGPKTRALEKTLSTVEKYTLGLFDKYTWDYLHTGIKLHVAESYLAKQKEAAAKSGGPFDEAKARSEIASFVNNAAGGLNWFKAATEAKTEFGRRMAMSAYSPAGRRALQTVLFAPDWTLSTVRAFTSALPEKLNPTQWHPVEGVKGMMNPTTKADYARLYQFKTALMYFTLINGINMMTANRPIWNNKDPTRIEWPDGTSMQAMKHAMEPYHWMMDPDKTFANKLGFIPKAMIVGFGGVEYASPNAPKLVDSSGPGRLKAVASMALPFQAAAAKNAPEGEATKRAVLGTLGFPEYGSNAAQKKAARAEREKALKKAAKEYHIKAKEKGWE